MKNSDVFGDARVVNAVGVDRWRSLEPRAGRNQKQPSDEEVAVQIYEGLTDDGLCFDRRAGQGLNL